MATPRPSYLLHSKLPVNLESSETAFKKLTADTDHISYDGTGSSLTSIKNLISWHSHKQHLHLEVHHDHWADV